MTTAVVVTAAATGVALRQPLAGTVVASLTVGLIAIVAWHTAQTTAIVHGRVISPPKSAGTP